ncbi:MAG: hypothetical protein AAGB34_09350 [Planctomycetota bacterium]
MTRRFAMRYQFTIVAAALIALSGTTTTAQNALGDGTALDNSLEQGQRVNRGRVDNSIDTSFRNAIVTGNVRGFQSFRGSLGYSAANDFRDSLGSDDLFEFARDSAYSGLASRGISSLDALQSSIGYTAAFQTNGIGGSPIVTRSFSGASSSQVLNLGSQSERFASDIYGQLRGTLRSTSEYTTRNATRPDVLLIASATEQSGDTASTTRRAITGSQLLGLRGLSLESPILTGIPEYERPTFTNLETLTQGLPQSNAAQEGPAPLPANFIQPNQLDAGFQGNQPLNAYDIALQSIRLSAQQLEPTILTNRVNVVEEEPEPDAASLYMDLLRDRFTIDPDQPNQITPEPIDLQPREAPAENAPQADANAEDGAALEEAEALLRNTQTRINTLVPIKSDDERYASHMDKGENMLSRGLYFTAEEHFTAALALRQGDPLASLGRVHAQLAAGLNRVAARNIRALFAAYPELIPAKTAAHLLPNQQRLNSIRNNLDRATANPIYGWRDAALVKAYLAHQTGNAERIREAFRSIETLGTDEESGQLTPLERTLESVWLAEESE